jgi:hypothetical protein
MRSRGMNAQGEPDAHMAKGRVIPERAALFSPPPTCPFCAEEIAALTARVAEPIPMLLFCPDCAAQHVDAPEPGSGWTNPPHKSHTCHTCGIIWRPADVPTVGVAAIGTKGGADTWDPSIRAEAGIVVALRATIAQRTEELAAARAVVGKLEAALKKVGRCEMCGGEGKRYPTCYRCSDSTDDHECPDSEPCRSCDATGARREIRDVLALVPADLRARVEATDRLIQIVREQHEDCQQAADHRANPRPRGGEVTAKDDP